MDKPKLMSENKRAECTICKLVAKRDTWFTEGTEVKVACFRLSKDGGGTYRRATLKEIYDWINESPLNVFVGERVPDPADCEHEIKFFGKESRRDEEMCGWDEFYIDTEGEEGMKSEEICDLLEEAKKEQERMKQIAVTKKISM